LTPTPGTGFWISRNVYHPETDYPPVTISVHLSLPGAYTLKVYNSAGELVKTLRQEWGATAPMDDVVQWDGKNDAGEKVASGVYVLQFTSRFDQRTAKLLILR
jgi:flagellar hook assembly protein FlgD